MQHSANYFGSKTLTAALVYFNPSADWTKHTMIWIKPVEPWKSAAPDSPTGA